MIDHLQSFHLAEKNFDTNFITNSWKKIETRGKRFDNYLAKFYDISLHETFIDENYIWYNLNTNFLILLDVLSGLKIRNRELVSFSFDKNFMLCQKLKKKLFKMKKNIIFNQYESINFESFCSDCNRERSQNYLTTFFYLFETHRKHRNLTKFLYALIGEGLSFETIEIFAQFIHFLYPCSYKLNTYE